MPGSRDARRRRRTAALFVSSFALVGATHRHVVQQSLSLNLAVGFDWAHFAGCRPSDYDCGVSDFWFPFVMQWNFFLTEAWSVFPEVGFAVHHAVWSWEAPGRRAGAGQVVCGPGPDPYCEYSDSYTRLAFVTWLGTRFALSDLFAFTLRVGVPAFVAGVSFRL